MDYAIRVSVRPIDPKHPRIKYSSNLWNGSFVSKGKKCSEAKIKEQVSAYLLSKLKEVEPEHDFEIKFLSIKRNDSKFTVVEDKV